MLFLYIRCARANRITGAGYLCLVTSVTLVGTTQALSLDALTKEMSWAGAFILFIMGVALLIATAFALNTVKGYRKATVELSRGSRTTTFIDHWSKRPYCLKCGAMLALKDHMKKHPPGN